MQEPTLLSYRQKGAIPAPVARRNPCYNIHKKNLVKLKRIIADYIKDHIIPHVSSLKKHKEVFDALTKLFKGKNINQKMMLRNQLRNVNIKNS